MQRKESVPSILESEATGKVAEIYADIRQVLGTSIVNLVWRNLATTVGRRSQSPLIGAAPASRARPR